MQFKYLFPDDELLKVLSAIQSWQNQSFFFRYLTGINRFQPNSNLSFCSNVALVKPETLFCYSVLKTLRPYACNHKQVNWSISICVFVLCGRQKHSSKMWFIVSFMVFANVKRNNNNTQYIVRGFCNLYIQLDIRWSARFVVLFRKLRHPYLDILASSLS